ncbi:MAG: two-component system phosphate regulon sensor histidine kinase PhoR [Halioglobus sp.]|jgi:two-component system phosphate regulon sensor histidine kinase PhoR
MRFSKVWLTEARRVLFLLAVGMFAGLILGRPLMGIGLCLFAVLAHWFYQLWRIQDWLSQPETVPPEGYGIWGDVFDRIYHLRRKEKEARQQLQSTVDYLRDSFASMRDGTVMVDETGAIAWSNEAAERLLGLRYPDDSGQAILNLVRAPEFHKYFLALDYSQSLQINIGGEVDLFLQIEVTRFGEGDRLVFARDITNVTRMEQMRRDFVANVSHELRTPLTVITGYLDTILDNTENLEPRYIKPLQQMSQQSARMESLLKDLLWLSRIESVRNIEQHEPVDIAGMLEEIRDELSNSHPERTLDLDIVCPAKIIGDYRELHSAVSNLIQNAIKYSPDAAAVTVRWARIENQCHLSVSDSGDGIGSAHLPRLTERFYRVDDSRSSATGGTGLGLAIVKHVAVAHNASLDIRSTLGQGSTFSLIFNCSELEEGPSRNIVHPSKSV